MMDRKIPLLIFLDKNKKITGVKSARSGYSVHVPVERLGFELEITIFIEEDEQ